MRRRVAMLVVFLMLCTQCMAFDCGKPFAPCGQAVPEGVKCEKGNGWCEAGHYCSSDKVAKAQCQPLPKDCGKAGSVCCPSNTDTPHTSDTYPLDRTPFCRDGRTCFFFPESRFTAVTPDPYAGVAGYACVALPADCGTKAGAPCCPSTWRTGTQPLLRKRQCPNNMFCQFDKEKGPKFPGSDLLSSTPGLCVANAPDCGKLGQRCCVSNEGCCTSTTCTPENGKKGYCANQPSGKLQDLICTQCPDIVDASFEYASDCRA